VRVQVGGSDQWGNITAGTELIRKLADDEERAAGGAGEGGGASLAAAEPPAFGATFPLLLKADGTKFGKSESGAIWLSADKLSPYRFYQALLATADADAPRLLRQLTFVPLEELATAEAAAGAAGAAPGALQRALAEEVTRWVHGEAGLVAARAATAALAPGAAAGTALDAAALEAVAGEAPSAELPRGAVLGAPLADVMVAAGLAASKGAVRRLIKGGGVSVNNAKVAGEDELRVVGAEDLIDGRLLLVAAGKKNKMLIRVVG
jgi:tyrosyl-tRNA synthetase